MRCSRRSLLTSLGATALAVAAFMSYTSPTVGAQGAAQERGGQDMYGPYEVVENWLKPLPDESDGIKHDGWTWGSQAAVFAETPDRIWIAQRGELTLPKGAKPWTPYAQISPSPGAATGPRLPDPAKPAPLVMRYHHVITVVNRDGKMVQWWQQHDKLFDQPKAPLGPRGPHKIKISRHVLPGLGASGRRARRQPDRGPGPGASGDAGRARAARDRRRCFAAPLGDRQHAARRAAGRLSRPGVVAAGACPGGPR